MSRKRSGIDAAWIAAVTVLAGCGDGNGPSSSNGAGGTTGVPSCESTASAVAEPVMLDAASQLDVDPQQTDQAITAIEGAGGPIAHRVYVPSQAIDRLVIMFTGSNGSPDGYTEFLQTAAGLGHHVIALSYHNNPSVGAHCMPFQDPTCYGKARLEMIDGCPRWDWSAPTPLGDALPQPGTPGHVAHDTTDSIENRLAKLLDHLRLTYPAAGWDFAMAATAQSCDANDPWAQTLPQLDWSRVVLAGHSQGGGHAAILAMKYEVARVVMLSAPTDMDGLTDSSANLAAEWVNTAGATPTNRYTGLVHNAEKAYAAVTRNWTAFGLEQPTTVDGQSSPHGGAKLLSTSWMPGTGSCQDAHHSTGGDTASPVDAQGELLLRAAWAHLLTVALD